MNIKFNNKVVIITGSARGIGFSIAKLFSKSGAIVIIADIDEENGKKAESEIKLTANKAKYIKLNLSNSKSFKSFINTVYESFGRIDILINNAKAGGKFDLLSENSKNWNITNDVILKSSFFLSQEAVKIMKKQNSGVVLNISSVAGILSTPESPSYHAAKGGLISLTKYLAVHCAQFKGRVNTILPGLIIQNDHLDRFYSDKNESYRKISETYQPGSEVGKEDDIAQAALFLCSDFSKYISGSSLVIDGAATSQEPFGLSFKISKLNE